MTTLPDPAQPAGRRDVAPQESGSVTALKGYDGRFGLKCWPDATLTGAPHEVRSDDEAALRAQAATLVDAGRFGVVELVAWNFELNDWVRMETFAAD